MFNKIAIHRFLIFIVLVVLNIIQTKVECQTLELYIKTGIKNSPLLKNFNNQLLSFGIDSSIIKAGRKPVINLSSQAIYAPSSKDFGYDYAITNGGNYSALLNVTQPILYNQINRARLQALSVSGQSLLANIKISENDLKKNITEHFLTAFADYSRIQSYKTILKLLQDQQLLLKQLVNKGVYLATDIINLILSIKSQEISIKQAFIQYKNDLGTLNFICGITDTSTIILQNPQIVLQNDFNINNSPLMMQFRIDSLRNITDKFLIDVNYKPHLNSFADVGFNAIIPKNIPDNFGGSIGLNFTIPIYDGRQRQLQHNKITLNENTRINQIEFYNKQFNQQRIQLTEQLKLTDDLISEIKNQISDQKHLINLYQIEIEKGLARVIDFLTLVNNYSLTVINLTLSEIDRMQIINQMNYMK